MGSCGLCRTIWPRIFVWIIFFTGLGSMVFLLLSGNLKIVFWIFIALALATFFGLKNWKVALERKCYIKRCHCQCHVTYRCTGKCHNWCKHKSDADLETIQESEEKVAGCNECVYRHMLFEGQFDDCVCECHEFRRPKRYKFLCRCHQWCKNKY